MQGGQNGDFYYVDDAGDSIVELADHIGIDRVLSGVDFVLGGAFVETLILGGSQDINGTGNSVNNYIIGNTGSNILLGLEGDDRLESGGGDDTIDGGAGADLLNGGPGSDRIIVDSLGDRVAESRRWEGVDTVESSVDFRMGSAHIENLELTGTARLGSGNGLANRITGNDADNLLDGGKNVDTLVGGTGDDTYLLRSPGDNAVELANEGVDTVRAFRSIELGANVENLYIQTLRNAAGEGVPGVNGFGNELANEIVGNPFDNVIAGRGGNDMLRGQAGADTFVFDRALGNNNVDKIVDFAPGEDMIALDDAVFRGILIGTLVQDAFIIGTSALDASDRIIYNSDNGGLYYDVDGTGDQAQIHFATLQNTAAITASDFDIF
jgi:Ca2+-binding RTX toxin-like protein